MSTPSTPPPNPPDPKDKFSNDPFFVLVYKELDLNQDQLAKRGVLIREIEAELTTRHGCQNRLIAYVLRYGHSRTQMHTSDIPNIESLLTSLSDAEQINVLLHSPGGDGSIVEKMVEMCRAHLVGANRKLRVIVPNIAKSAATVFALGADEIVMGYISELGPIDPQVHTVVSNSNQWLSAAAFVQARDNLMTQIAEALKKQEPTVGLLQQLAGLNIPFTVEMENQIEFARKTAVALLDKYMLKPRIKAAAKRKSKAEEIAANLLSKKLFPSHGHYINGPTARALGWKLNFWTRTIHFGNLSGNTTFDVRYR